VKPKILNFLTPHFMFRQGVSSHISSVFQYVVIFVKNAYTYTFYYHNSSTDVNVLNTQKAVVKMYLALLKNLKVHHHVHKSTLVVPNPCQMNADYNHRPYSLHIYLNIILPSRSISSEWSFSFRLSKLHFVHIYHLPMSTTCLIIPYLI
jgi:hypothetical protein